VDRFEKKQAVFIKQMSSFNETHPLPANYVISLSFSLSCHLFNPATPA